MYITKNIINHDKQLMYLIIKQVQLNNLTSRFSTAIQWCQATTLMSTWLAVTSPTSRRIPNACARRTFSARIRIHCGNPLQNPAGMVEISPIWVGTSTLNYIYIYITIVVGKSIFNYSFFVWKATINSHILVGTSNFQLGKINIYIINYKSSHI